MLGPAQGLIHISELSWSVVLTPDAVVQPGSLVRCKVKRVDRDKGQIQLSLKARARRPAPRAPGCAAGPRAHARVLCNGACLRALLEAPRRAAPFIRMCSCGGGPDGSPVLVEHSNCL